MEKEKVNSEYYKFDGISHINVYSKGKTELGRWLSNFTKSPINTEDGSFNSIEGYWYWLSSKDDHLRQLSGFSAKEYGRKIGANDWLEDEEFFIKIKKAIKIKLETFPEQKKKFKESTLPFTHYYLYGDKVVNVPKAKWIIDYLTDLRNEFISNEQL